MTPISLLTATTESSAVSAVIALRAASISTRPSPPTGSTTTSAPIERSHSAVSSTQACSVRSEEHTSELQSLMRISYAVFCLKKKTNKNAIMRENHKYHLLSHTQTHT